MKKIISAILTILMATIANAQSAVNWEYFFDTDAGFGQNTVLPVVPDTDVTIIPGPLPVFSSVSLGFHKFYSRVQDSFGNWSHTSRRNVDILEVDTALYMVEIEYFFVDSSDLGFGDCHDFHIPLPFEDDTVTFNIPSAQLPLNTLDTLFIRARDSVHSRWSHTVRLSVDYTGIVEINPVAFKISPNPATNILNIDLGSMAVKPIKFTLTNLMGQKLEERILVSSKMSLGLNYPAGVYLVTLNNDRKVFTQKLVIQDE